MLSRDASGEMRLPGHLWIQQEGLRGPEGDEIAMARMSLAAGDAEEFYSDHPQLVRPEVVEVFGFSKGFVDAARTRLEELDQERTLRALEAAGRPPSQFFD